MSISIPDGNESTVVSPVAMEMEIIEVPSKYSVAHHAIFRDKERNILGLFVYHYFSGTVFINDSTSSSSFEQLSEEKKELYRSHGFNGEVTTQKGLGKFMLDRLLQYIYETYDNVCWVNFSGYIDGSNTSRLKVLLDRTKDISDRIIDIRGGSDTCAWTVQIRKTS